MTEKKVYLLIVAAILLLALSFAIPLAITFAPKTSPTATPTDAITTILLDAPLQPLTQRNGTEEMRGLWIATHYNINFPSKQGLSKDALEMELDSIVAFAKKNGFNTIMFQVRPAADALYKSDIFPYSNVVSGANGKTPDGEFDCLEYLLTVARGENIRVHAWINPLRAATSANAVLSDASPVKKYPEIVVEYDGKLYFDAGQNAARELVASGVREICENYDVDGIVFDDYFYPEADENNTPFDDAATFAAYGGDMSLGDFRRDSVNKLIKLCYDTVKEVSEDIEFGVSPAGIWKNGGEGSDTRGFEAYESIYCDALAWARGGYVDYIAPQVYWSFDTAVAPFDTVAEWWDGALMNTGVKLYINHGVYKYDEGTMHSGEITKQIDFSRTLDAYRGSMFYGYGALVNNTDGVLDELDSEFENIIIYFSPND